MNKIRVKDRYDYNQQQVLKRLIYSIQHKYDINPIIINNWFESKEFQDTFDSKNREVYINIMKQDNPILDKLLEISHADSFIQEYIPWESEKCGQILEEFSNGYIKYCNKHKYLHQTNKYTNEIDHCFVNKNEQDIIEEQIFKLRLNLYIDYTRKLAEVMSTIFDDKLKSEYNTYYMLYSENNDKLIKWLKKKSLNFREKRPTYHESTVYIKIYITNGSKLPDLELSKKF